MLKKERPLQNRSMSDGLSTLVVIDPNDPLRRARSAPMVLLYGKMARKSTGRNRYSGQRDLPDRSIITVEDGPASRRG